MSKYPETHKCKGPPVLKVIGIQHRLESTVKGDLEMVEIGARWFSWETDLGKRHVHWGGDNGKERSG